MLQLLFVSGMKKLTRWFGGPAILRLSKQNLLKSKENVQFYYTGRLDDVPFLLFLSLIVHITYLLGGKVGYNFF